MKSKGISRRKFIKNLSTSVVGTGVALSSITHTAGAETLNETEPSALNGKIRISLIVNKKNITVDIESHLTLAELLRDKLQLTGTKVVCDHGECGACTVLLEGKAVYSCHMLALDAAGKEVTTIEGLMDGEKLHPLQESFAEHDGLQCGFCTPGQIMSAYALLQDNPNLTRDDIFRGMSGNICRCGAYPNILKAVEAAAKGAKNG